MPNATLLLREDNSSGSLAALVEKSQQQQQQQRNKTLPEYQIELNSCQLDLILIKNEKPTLQLPASASSSSVVPQQHHHHHQQDEGFESDIDSLSIVSSDGSITTKTAETDSANGSASSDSDTEPPTPPPTVPSLSNSNNTEIINKNDNYPKESYNLVDCVCYTDVKFPNLLIFAIKNEGLVFQFENLNNLRSFYLNFTALKAVTNQKAYSKSSAKFNLLQRTDNNGVTHIEITREPEQTLFFSGGTTATTPTTNIISLNTPETVNRKQQNHHNNNENKKNTLPLSRNYNNFQDSSTVSRYRTLSHYASSENILKLVSKTPPTKSNEQLRKVWNSAEDLLNSSTTPKRPDRRKKIKGRAPPPPAVPQSAAATTAAPTPSADVLRGEYVRVNVIPDTVSKESSFIAKSQLKDSKKPVTRSNLVTLLSSSSNSSTHQKSNRLLKIEPPSWTNSVPRLLNKAKHYQTPQQLVPQQHQFLFQQKQRSKSETRTFTPMAYRYIDTAPMYTPPMGNRLFGLSSKLRDFSNTPSVTAEGRNGGTLEYKKRSWCASTNNIDSGTAGCGPSTNSSSNSKNNLKSVIKKDENRKSTKTNEKKVTFSAYTTVQVV